MKTILDRKNRKIREFDLLQVFHFIGARKKIHFMYKWVREKDGELHGVHLDDAEGKSFPLWVVADKETGVFHDAEIIQTRYDG